MPQDTFDPRYKVFVKSNQGTEDLPDPEDVPSPSERARGNSQVAHISAAMTPFVVCTCAAAVFCLVERFNVSSHLSV